MFMYVPDLAWVGWIPSLRGKRKKRKRTRHAQMLGGNDAHDYSRHTTSNALKFMLHRVLTRGIVIVEKRSGDNTLCRPLSSDGQPTTHSASCLLLQSLYSSSLQKDLPRPPTTRASQKEWHLSRVLYSRIFGYDLS